MLSDIPKLESFLNSNDRFTDGKAFAKSIIAAKTCFFFLDFFVMNLEDCRKWVRTKIRSTVERLIHHPHSTGRKLKSTGRRENFQVY